MDRGRGAQGTSTVRCPCCGLDHDVPADGDVEAVSICARCTSHRGEHVAIVAVREADHAALYKHAMIDAQDDVVLARAERDFYRHKMQAAYSTRQLLVEVLARIDQLHHRRGKRCVCGKPGCRVPAALEDPRVARLVRSYDEQQRTLRELQHANPQIWTEAWDFIDDALVYPKQPERGSVGRHRKSG
jgi:hypothetical protein